MKEFLDAAIIIAAVFVGVLANNYWNNKNLTCAQAVLHNNVAKCAVYIDKDVMR